MAKKKGNDAREGTSAARVVFELEEQEVRLVHKNERLEKHGEEGRLACDLNFEWDTSNEALAMWLVARVRHAGDSRPRWRARSEGAAIGSFRL